MDGVEAANEGTKYLQNNRQTFVFLGEQYSREAANEEQMRGKQGGTIPTR